MRRAELEVGALLYHRSSQYAPGQAVTVVATEPYETNSYSGAHRRATGGHGVLVQYVSHQGGAWVEGRTTVVRLAHLLGDWATLHAEEVAEAERAQAEYVAHKVAKDAEFEALSELVAALNRETGLDIKVYSWGDGKLSLSLAELGRVVGALEARP